MTLLDLVTPRRNRPGRNPPPSNPQPERARASRLSNSGILEVETQYVSPNPENAQQYFGNRKFKEALLRSSVFIYGKVWFYNAILELVLNTDWQKSHTIKIIHSPRQLVKAPAKNTQKALVILPSVHDQTSLNLLVSKALETNLPVWFIGYPSTLARHLLTAFQSFVLCDASQHEIEILSDVAELSSVDVEFLKEKQKRCVWVSKGNAQPIHVEF